MERFILNDLIKWKNSKYRKPLILKGVRQVGKTWILKEFGNICYENIAYFNFDENPEYRQFFQTTKDINRILQNLILISGYKIVPEKTLIIFDEVQDAPEVINSLKYFYENTPEYHITCAGSLLGIALAKPSSFPVGKIDFLNIYPMSFSEFLLANGDENLKLFLDDEDKRNRLVSSPFNYTGGKYKLLEQLQKLFKEEEIFLDIFAGGANVGINSKSQKIIFNDVNAKIISLIEYIKNIDTEELLKKIDNIIVEYGLSNTMLYGYKYYSCNSSEGLANYNKEAFLKLRKDYNKKLNERIEDYILLYVLIVFSFNNQVRFNSKGEFNLPVGKRDFNSKMRNKLILFSKKLKEKEIEFCSKDFREIDINKISKNTFIYCDPPYLITTAGYNENGMWTDKEEKDLLNFLKELDKKGLKFALSNVLESKNKENKILKDWILENNFYCNYLKKDYSNSNYQRKAKNSISVEVLVTNYNTDEM